MLAANLEPFLVDWKAACHLYQHLHRQLLIEHTTVRDMHMQLKKDYRTALDEVSALLEKNDELRDRIERFQSAPNNFVVPTAMVICDELPFEKKVLSLGMYGKIRDSFADLSHIKYSYAGSDLQGDRAEFLAQFGPMIIEEVRSKAVKRIAEIEKSDPPHIVGEVHATCFPEEDELKENIRPEKNRKDRNRVSFGFVVLKCTTCKKTFPVLKHGFLKELLCVVLPSTNKKELNIVFAIGTKRATRDADNIVDVVEYSIMMLAHDYNLLFEHARNTLRKQDPQADLSNPLQRISWHHITGLIPDLRMYEATRPNAPFHFDEQVLQQREVLWPDPKGRLVLKNNSNIIQTRVVQSMSRTKDCGLFRLIGPPGTGKTTTIVALLLERMRRFSAEKILLTAPSNKAIQVVLHKLVEENNADYAIAVIGTNKDIPLQHEALYAAEFTSPFVTRLCALYKSQESGRMRKQTFRKIVDDVTERLQHLTDSTRPGLPVSEPVKRAVRDVAQEFVSFNFSNISDKESLNEHILDCRDLLRGAAENIERFILQRAQVVFSTLIASGRKNFFKVVSSFDTVIVDEASQALVPATFIPFKFNPARYLLVGDPQQLPATVQADHLKPLGYADSLMLVMQREMGNSACSEMLTTQYRMHPAICKVISDLFYEGKLVTDESVLSRQCLLQQHLPAHMLLRNTPSAFIDLDSEEYRIEGGSISNVKEANLIVEVVRYLVEHGVKPHQIGVVSGYATQVALLNKKLQNDKLAQLAVSTVDGFQGDEKDFMLFSCVRTSAAVGFLSDARRINVAMSRGRHANWVFGQARTLRESNSTIRDFLNWTDDASSNSISPCTREITADALLESMK